MWLGRAIAQTVRPRERRTAFHRVADIDVLAGKPDRAKHPIEQLSGASHEGTAELILGFTWTFADHHQPSAWIAFTVDVVAPLISDLALAASGGTRRGFSEQRYPPRALHFIHSRALRLANRDRAPKRNDLARSVASFRNVELQPDDGVGAQRVGMTSQRLERVAAQLLGITQKLGSRQPDQHPEAAEGRAQTVARARRASRNVSEATQRAIAVELVERDDVLAGDHGWRNEGTGMPKVSPSVLIIRLDAIGDALALTPLLAAFRRRALPVDLVMTRANADVFTPLAARRILAAEIELRSSARSNLASIERLGAELRLNRYSHVLVATEDSAGYRLAAATGAPVRIGFLNAWGKPFKTLWAKRILTVGIYRSAGLDRRAPHECEVLFRLGEPLVNGERPTRDLDELRPLLIDDGSAPDDRVAIQITDKWERLGISFEEVVEMVRRIAAGGTPRLFSARSEETYARRISQATGLTVDRFGDIGAWKNSIAAAPAIVTPDSAALHLAGMIGTPVVAVFPPQRGYALQIARWAPWASPHRLVRADHGWPARVDEALAQLAW